MLTFNAAHDSDAAPDSPAPDSSDETPATAAELASGSSDDALGQGPPRDAAGRFTKGTADADDPDDTTAPADAATSDEDRDATAAEPDAADEDPKDPAEPTEEPEGQEKPAAPAPVIAKPFPVRVHGQEFAVEGTGLTETGHLVAEPSAVPRIQQLIAQGRAYETVGRQREQELRSQLHEVATRYDEKLARAESTLEWFDGLLEDARTRGWDAVIAEAEEFEAAIPMIRGQIDLDARQRALDARERQLAGPEPTPDEQHAATVEVIRNTFDAAVELARQALPTFGQLTGEELEDVKADLAGYADYFIRAAEPDDVRRFPDAGLEVGEPFLDEERYAAIAEQLAAAKVNPRLAAEKAAREAAERTRRELQEANRKKEAARRANAQRLGPNGNPLPPVPGAAGQAATVSAGAEGPKLKTSDDYEKLKMRLGL